MDTVISYEVFHSSDRTSGSIPCLYLVISVETLDFYRTLGSIPCLYLVISVETLDFDRTSGSIPWLYLIISVETLDFAGGMINLTPY